MNAPVPGRVHVCPLAPMSAGIAILTLLLFVLSIGFLAPGQHGLHRLRFQPPLAHHARRA